MRKPQAECADYPNAVGGGMRSPSALFDLVLAYKQLLNLKLNLFKRENLDHNIIIISLTL